MLGDMQGLQARDDEPIDEPIEIEEQQDDEIQEQRTDDSPEREITDDEREKARKTGHLSKEEYQKKYGTLRGYKDEKQFNAYAEAYPEIKQLKEKLSEQNKNIEYLVDAHKRTAEQSVQQARAELNRQIALAKSNGDIDSAVQLTEQRMQLEMQQNQNQMSPDDLERTKLDNAFIERNKHWFNADPDLTEEAKQIGNRYSQTHRDVSYAQVVRHVEETMRYLHPEIEINAPKRTPLSSTRSAVNRSASAPQDDERFMRNLTKEELQDFKATKELFENSSVIRRMPEDKRPKYTLKDFMEAKARRK